MIFISILKLAVWLINSKEIVCSSDCEIPVPYKSDVPVDESCNSCVAETIVLCIWFTDY